MALVIIYIYIKLLSTTKVINKMFQNTKKHLSSLTKQLEDLTAEHDVLELTLEKVCFCFIS